MRLHVETAQQRLGQLKESSLVKSARRKLPGETEGGRAAQVL